MQQLVELEEKTRAYNAVRELMKYSGMLLPATEFYLAQLRELLRNEIAGIEQHEQEDDQRRAA